MYYEMQRNFFPVLIIFLFLILNSCSKKISPSRTPVVTVTEKYSDMKMADTSSVAPKPALSPGKTGTIEKSAAKTEFPKVITVNDLAARKSVDGRLYYDVKGHRYWRNNKDGKYYLFDKSMYNNPDFASDKTK